MDPLQRVSSSSDQIPSHETIEIIDMYIFIVEEKVRVGGS